MDRLANYKWYNFPLGNKPRGDIETYKKLAQEVKNKNYPTINNYEQKNGFAINTDWLNKLALHTQIIIKTSEPCYQHGRLLYTTIRKYIQAHQLPQLNILETGTARGFSSLCMAKALQDADTEGKIITFDVLPHNTKMYWNCIDDLDGPKTRAKLLSDYTALINRYIVFHQGNSRIEVPKVYLGRVHFAFLDGAHTYRDVWHEFNYVKDHQKNGDIIFFDDYTQSLFSGVVKAVDEICEKHNYTKKVIAVNLNRGYVIAEKNDGNKPVRNNEA